MSLWLFVSTYQRKDHMKNDTPLNPLPLPENLKLNPDTGATKQAGQSSEKNTATRQARSKTKGSSKRSKRHQSGASRMKKNCRVQWEELKGRLAARVAQMDKERLKAALLACGVAAGIVAAAIAAIKLLPVTAIILAALGLGAALRFWQQLRHMPRPF